jgi:type 1 glutamine amidotransferase
VGVVALHHTLAAFKEWPEFQRILGGRFDSDPSSGKEPGRYQHDLDMLIEVADKTHPVTQDLVEFMIHDEAYQGLWHARDNVVLLTCDHPASDKAIAWTRVYRNARVCTIQLGHDHFAYENPHFRRLVFQAMQWTSQR